MQQDKRMTKYQKRDIRNGCLLRVTSITQMPFPKHEKEGRKDSHNVTGLIILRITYNSYGKPYD